MKNAELIDILEMSIINYEKTLFLSNCDMKMFLFRRGSVKFAAVFKRKNFRFTVQTAVSVKLNALKALK